jgi:hypothetical protein
MATKEKSRRRRRDRREIRQDLLTTPVDGEPPH